MSFENVNLWFAKDKNNEIMMIKDIIEENKHSEYTCPICGGLVRANTGKIKSWYFSHINADDCSSETIVHWFVKHEFLKVGDKFKVNVDEEIKEYECKEIIAEKEYNTKYGVYRPDLTVITTTNEVIYIEIANTNKKKIKDFIGTWKELCNTVIEFKVGEILDGNKIDIFNSIWYVGKEYNEQLKELRQICNKEKEKYSFTKEQVEQIDWLIDDICKYNNGLIEIDELSDEIQCIENEKQRQLVCNIVKNKKCGNVLEDYVEYNKNLTIQGLKDKYNYLCLCNIDCEYERLIYDRLFKGFIINIRYNNIFVLSSASIKYNSKNLLSSFGRFKENYMFIELCEYVKEKYNLKLTRDSYNYYLEEEKIYPIGHIKNIKQNIDNLVSKIKYSKTINKLINDLNERLNKIEKHKYYCEFIVGNKSYYDYKFLLYDYNLYNLVIYIIKDIIEVKIDDYGFSRKTILRKEIKGDIDNKIYFISNYISDYIRKKKYNIK